MKTERERLIEKATKLSNKGDACQMAGDAQLAEAYHGQTEKIWEALKPE